MKIVVLDGYAMNPGDLDWSQLATLGKLAVYDRTPPDKTLERSIGAEVLLTNKTLLSREHINSLEHLRYIGVLATGYAYSGEFEQLFCFYSNGHSVRNRTVLGA